jgi:hypothetical protein
MAKHKHWSRTCPKAPGVYFMRCMESGGDEVRATVIRDEILMATTADLGTMPVVDLHNGLTTVSWRRPTKEEMAP